MKKTVFSLLAAVAIGNSALQAENAGLYIGAGYANTSIDFSANDLLELPALDAVMDSLILLAGVDFNEYIGIEGRYYWNITSGIKYEKSINGSGILDDYKAESFAFYAKPQYSFDIISIYALLGVTMNDYSALLESESDTLFSWGAGIRLKITEGFGAFVDYTDLGESDIMLTSGLSSWNFGLSYKF